MLADGKGIAFFVSDYGRSLYKLFFASLSPMVVS